MIALQCIQITSGGSRSLRSKERREGPESLIDTERVTTTVGYRRELNKYVY